jgi:hypothetical protein
MEEQRFKLYAIYYLYSGTGPTGHPCPLTITDHADFWGTNRLTNFSHGLGLTSPIGWLGAG